MKYRISGEICGTNVVTPKNRRLILRNPQLSKKRLYPDELGGGISHRFVFSFSTTARYYSLLASIPGNQIRPKEYCIAPRGSPVNRTASPICI